MHILSRHILVALSVAAALVALSLAGAPYVRMALLPQELRYVPADAVNIVYAPKLGELWRVLDVHCSAAEAGNPTPAGADGAPLSGCASSDALSFSGEGSDIAVLQVWRAIDGAGALIGLLAANPNAEISDSDRSAQLAPSVWRSMQQAGVALDRPFVAAFRGPIGTADFVAVIPVADRNKFADAIADSVKSAVEVRIVETPAAAPLREVLDPARAAGVVAELEDAAGAVRVGAFVDAEPGALSRISVFPSARLCSGALRAAPIPSGDQVLAVRENNGVDRPVIVQHVSEDADVVPSDATPSQPASGDPALDASALSASIDIGGRNLEVRLAGASACYAFLDDSHAIVFSNLETLEQALAEGGAIRALAGQQTFTRGMQMTAPRSGSPQLAWAYLRYPHPYGEALSPSFVSLSGDNTRLELRAWSGPPVFYSNRVRSLIGPSGLVRGDGHRQVGRGAFAAVESGDLHAALGFANSITSGGLDGLLAGSADDRQYERYRPVLRALLETPDVDRLSVSVVGVRERVPQLVLRATMPQAQAQSLVLELQRSQLRARDRAILARAAEDYANPLPENGWASGVNALTLERAGFLTREPGVEDGWRRAFTAPPTNTFEGADYTECVDRPAAGCRRAAYLLPPFTANDEILIEQNLPNREEVLQRLREGRYRMASAYDDGVLWVAPDMDVLRQAFEDLEGAEPVARGENGAERRLHVFFEPRWLDSQRRLDGAAEEGETEWDRAIRGHAIYQSVELNVDALSSDNGFILDLTARR